MRILTDRLAMIPAAVRSALAIAFTALPVLVAAVRAAAGEWMPIGDSAYFTARSLDVATGEHPLLGAWSSGSFGTGTPVNNLGPLQLDLLAPFTKIAPSGGTAIGVATVHIASIVVIGWLVHRMGGVRYVLAAMAAVSVLAWTMGSENLIAAVQHPYLVLPYLALLVAAWAVAAGHPWALVPVVIFGSLTTQTHLSHLVLTAALAVPMAIGTVVSYRRRDTASDRRVHWYLPYVVSAVLVVVLWFQTVIDQIGGRGNVSNVLKADSDAPTPTVLEAGRLVAAVVATPRGYLRPGFGDYGPLVPLADTWVFVLLVVAWSVALGVSVVLVRHHRTTIAAGFMVAVAAVAAGVLNARLLPEAAFGLYSGNYRWLWSTSTLLAIGAFCALVRVSTSDVRFGRGVVWGLAFLVAAASVANLPSSLEIRDAEYYREQLDGATELAAELDFDGIDGPVVVDEDYGLFALPYSYVILTALTRDGIDYHFEAVAQRRRFGLGRRVDGTETHRLEMFVGEYAEYLADDDDTISYVRDPRPTAVVVTEITEDSKRAAVEED